jgi:hypothetical protein
VYIGKLFWLPCLVISATVRLRRAHTHAHTHTCILTYKNKMRFSVFSTTLVEMSGSETIYGHLGLTLLLYTKEIHAVWCGLHVKSASY